MFRKALSNFDRDSLGFAQLSFEELCALSEFFSSQTVLILFSLSSLNLRNNSKSDDEREPSLSPEVSKLPQRGRFPCFETNDGKMLE